ncbi:hypothetical protein AWB64_03229 [Caballeronia sordidicola]|uniref:Chemotaxis phosphatase CheX-like domain-containing protein n=1 Tax=Caballeronia sordidicola TaxID=196367 RepID=A0A158GNT3_CABSO|nr:hypothetical protein [Caballeronia sordidicola]SAL33776.1 hypothetical protein AWB64_03229 [Caballeronia sordidicola]
MISSNAQASIEGLFMKAVRSRLPQEAEDTCDIVLLARDENSMNVRDSNVVFLTISSIQFRILLVFHFDEDERTRGYFVKDVEEGSLRDALLETCNLCCGAMNQELLRYFPDLGMSTPYVLSARCLSYLEELKPDYLASYAITISGSVKLGATVCFCAHAPVDFIADVNMAEETSGELELF